MSQTDNPGQRIHIWQGCHHCERKPIIGARYHCLTCPVGPDSDLCEPCYLEFQKGAVVHPPKDHYALKNKRTGNHRFQSYEGLPEQGYAPWLDVRQAVAIPPKVPDQAIVRPEFCVGHDSYFGGHAFAARLPGSKHSLLLTALHVMDELIKDQKIDAGVGNHAYTGQEIPAVLTRVRLYDLFQERWMAAPLGEAGPMLALPDARVDEEEPLSDRDIAAFRLSETSSLAAFELAEAAPSVGEAVWLAARLDGYQLSRVAKAVVVERGDRSLIFRFAQHELNHKYTSGAPILDRRGRVAGINVGGGQFRGQKFGHANHVGHIHRHLTPHENGLFEPGAPEKEA